MIYFLVNVAPLSEFRLIESNIFRLKILSTLSGIASSVNHMKVVLSDVLMGLKPQTMVLATQIVTVLRALHSALRLDIAKTIQGMGEDR